MKSQLNILQLAYPPISNQEAEWLKDDPGVKACLIDSKLYMIGQRKEIFFDFDNSTIEKELNLNRTATIQISCGNRRSHVKINFLKIFQDRNISLDDIGFELGSKMIRVWVGEPKALGSILVDWFTTDKLLWDRWHEHPAISGLDNYKEFTEFDLHYVGISKKEDSLTRLVVRPHDKRLRILSNEKSKASNSRLTDEMVLFFFKINPLYMSTVETEVDLLEVMSGPNANSIRILADAEKAFVHILKSKYNTIQFEKFPQSTDGLYETGLNNYQYVIEEDLTFITDHEELVGGFNRFTKPVDFILVDGAKVSLIKSGNHRM